MSNKEGLMSDNWDFIEEAAPFSTESLEFKYSIPLNDFVCFQTKELETLYEYKDKIS